MAISSDVKPTRMELKKTKARLKTAVRGHKLLKDKRDELMRQFLLTVRENKALRQKVEAGLAEAMENMAKASRLMSPEILEQSLLCPKQSVEVDISLKNISWTVSKTCSSPCPTRWTASSTLPTIPGTSAAMTRKRTVSCPFPRPG